MVKRGAVVLFVGFTITFSLLGCASVVSFKRDLAKEDYDFTLLEDVPFDGKLFVPDIVEFLKTGESCVSSEVTTQRDTELNAHLGQRHAAHLLKHQKLIPKEWRGKYFLTFPGTVWWDSSGSRAIPYLYWYDGGWYLSFHWLRNVWRSDCR